MRLALRRAIVLVAALFPAATWAAEPVPRSVLILDHTNSVAALDQAFRVTLNARPELRHGPFCR